LEHARIFYFHNNNQPKLYGGSADIMVRSFDKRIESLFEMVDDEVKRQIMHILDYNLRDNVNSYELQEDGTYIKVMPENEPFDIHQRFFEVKEKEEEPFALFDEINDTMSELVNEQVSE
jgi:polyphosphate kinase